MLDNVPDAPDWDECEAEIERRERHRKRISAMYEQEERREDEERNERD